MGRGVLGFGGKRGDECGFGDEWGIGGSRGSLGCGVFVKNLTSQMT